MTKYDLEKLTKSTSKDYAKRYLILINNRKYHPYYATTTKEEAKEVKRLAIKKRYLTVIKPALKAVKDKYPQARWIVWVTSKWTTK